MHCQEELVRDLGEDRRLGFITEQMIMKWHLDRYSTSRHLWALFSIVTGLSAKVITEIGVGRSTFVLALAARCNQGNLIICDRYDYRYMFTEQEKKIMTYIHGQSEAFFEHPAVQYGIDFMFMDYLSTKKRDAQSCYKEMKKAFKLLRRNGIIAIHDVCEKKYNAGKGLERFKKKYEGQCEVFSLPYCYGLGLIRKTVDSDMGKLELKYAKKPDSNS